MKPTVVQFGAGAIGRGFLGQLWSEAGYEVVFVDVNEGLVNAMNERGSYPLHLVTNEAVDARTIAPVRAIHASNVPAVLAELRTCAFAATAVGPGMDALLSNVFAPFLMERGKTRRPDPLNVILCENNPILYQLIPYVLDSILPSVSGNTHAKRRERVRFVQAVVGRMVPAPTPDANDDPLLVRAEPYKELPIQRRWQGNPPEVPGMRLVPDFDSYVRRKMYVHNGGHATLAYHGSLRGYDHIWQCAEDSPIVSELTGFWNEANAYLMYYHINRAELEAHEVDLLHRFRNRALSDTVARVARNPVRKLAAGDRLTSLALRCRYTKVAEPTYTCRAIAAALLYNNPNDPEACFIQAQITTLGLPSAFFAISGVPSDDPRGLAPMVVDAYNDLVARYKAR